jgi:hypothetical protein
MDRVMARHLSADRRCHPLHQRPRKGQSSAGVSENFLRKLDGGKDTNLCIRGGAQQSGSGRAARQ